MNIVLNIVLALFVGGFLLVVALAMIPLHLRLTFGSGVKRLRVGLWRLTLVDTARAKLKQGPGESGRRSKHREQSSTEAPGSSSSKRWREIWRMSRVAPELAKAALMYVARVAGKVRLKGFRGTVGGGLADPGDTGMAFGVLYALAGAAPGLGEKLKMEPDYLAERIEYDLRGEVSLRPISLLGPTVKLIGELPKRELIGILRENRRRRRKAAS